MPERLDNRRHCVVRVLVERLAPYKGRVDDPCCGSAGMFVQSEKFVEVHGGRIGDIAVYGQESNSTTRRMAMLNLAIRGIEGDLGPEHTDTCESCGATMGSDVKLLLDSDRCPQCEKGTLTANRPECTACGFSVNPDHVVWA